MFFQTNDGRRMVYAIERAVHDVVNYAFTVSRRYKDVFLCGGPPIISGENNKYDMKVLSDIIEGNGNINYALTHIHSTNSSQNTIRVKIERRKKPTIKDKQMGNIEKVVYDRTEIDELRDRVKSNFRTSGYLEYIVQVWLHRDFIHHIADIINNTAASKQTRDDKHKYITAEDIHNIAVNDVEPYFNENTIRNMYRVKSKDWIGFYDEYKDKVDVFEKKYIHISHIKNSTFAEMPYWMLSDTGCDVKIIADSGSIRKKKEDVRRTFFNNNIMLWV